MRWASAISTADELCDAVAECCSALDATMDGAAPDLVIAFVSPHYSESWRGLPDQIGVRYPGATQLGCTANGVVGGGREIEGERALAMTCASLPGVDLEPLVFEGDPWADPRSCCPALGALVDSVAEADGEPSRTPIFVVLPEPFTCPAEPLVAGLDRLFPASIKIGGLASAANQPAGNMLWVGGEVVRSGAVALALRGDIEVSTIVAQGCRPIGVPMFVTRAEGNVIAELDGASPIEALQNAYATASPSERELFRHSLFLGVVMREGESAPTRGPSEKRSATWSPCTRRL